MDGAQDPRAYTVGVGLGFRSRPAGSEGCPLGAWEAEGEVEKWVVMVGLPLAYHSTMMPNFYGVLGFFHIFFFFFLVVELLTPVLSSYVSIASSCPLPESTLQILLFST